MRIITDNSDHNRHQETFTRILQEILQPVMGKNINMSVPHQDTVKMQDDGDFYIHIWSSAPGNRANINPPSEMYGIEVSCNDRAYGPLNNNKTEKIFYCPNTNYAVAELFSDNLYIHHDICHRGTKAEIAIFKRLIQDVAEWFSLKSPIYFQEKTQQELEKIGSSKAKEKFIAVLGKNNLTALAETKAKLEQLTKKTGIFDENIASYLKKKTELYAKIERYASSDSKERKTFELEYDRLLTVPDVYGAQIENNILQVFTGMIRITAENTGITYRIGKFRIDIPLIPEERGLRFINLTNNGNGPGKKQPRDFDASAQYNRHHPHVNEIGEACLGNIKDAMKQYIIEHQYSVVAILAMQFLKTVNVEDGAGKGIKWWPKETSV